MPNYKLVDADALDNNLTSVANAIREKAGTSDALEFPGGFVDAVGGIQAGGGDDSDVLKGLIERTLTDITLPQYLTKIGKCAFYSYSNLALTSLPSGITSIGDNAFYSCRNITITSLPSGIESIMSFAFGNCTGLRTIIFNSKPKSLSNSAFYGCTNITAINVPWSEGEVSGAPWGATNATINYNYTGG